jgi:hypothetical protein
MALRRNEETRPPLLPSPSPLASGRLKDDDVKLFGVGKGLFELGSGGKVRVEVPVGGADAVELGFVETELILDCYGEEGIL